jgi:hypothetical protein
MPADDFITGATTLTATDQLRAFWWGAGRLVRLMFILAALMVLVLLVVTLGTLEDDSESWTTPLLALIALLIIWPAMVLWGFRRMSPEQRQLSYEIDRRHVATRDATGAVSAIPWSVIRRFTERRRGFAIALKPAGLRWIPTRAFTPQAIEDLRTLARAKLGKAARVRG